jgi:polyisoprenoid-binding protein YceI
MTRLRLLLAFAAALAAPLAASARVYVVDRAASKLSFTGSFDGRPFSGVFRNWDAQIDFDPARLDTSKVVVVIQAGSVRTGTPEYDSTIGEPAWFAVRQFPTARFVASSFRKTGANRYEASGQLTIRNVTRPATLPFTLQQEGARTRMRGELTLDRTQFGVGAGEFSGDAPLKKAVRVQVDLLATPR